MNVDLKNKDQLKNYFEYFTNFHIILFFFSDGRKHIKRKRKRRK